jgi:dipeptidase
MPEISGNSGIFPEAGLKSFHVAAGSTVSATHSHQPDSRLTTGKTVVDEQSRPSSP